MTQNAGAMQHDRPAWTGLAGWPSHAQESMSQSTSRAVPPSSPAVGPNSYSRSLDAYGQAYNTLVRPSAQYRQTEDSRTSYDDQGVLSAAAWQRDNRAAPAATGMWHASEPQTSTYNFGSDAGLSAWQQQLAQLQQPTSASQAQHQGWPAPGTAGYQQAQQQQQQQQQSLQLARKLSSGDQLVQDLRLSQWASMASPPHQQHIGNSQLPHAMPAPPAGSGFENMWGTATSNEMAPAQAVANPNTHFPEDAATLLDFPDWDGPGLAAALPLDDMIMNSIGQSGQPMAPADSPLPQGSDAGTARPSSDGQAAHPGVPKKKHKAGKKAGKAAATASGGLPEEPAVEFLVATEAYQEQDGTLMKGVTTPPVKVLTEEPMNNLLPAAAYANLKQPLPLQDPQLAILKWTLSNCL